MRTENRPAMLVVDDEPDLREVLGALLGDQIYVNRNTLIAKMQQYALRPPGGTRPSARKTDQTLI